MISVKRRQRSCFNKASIQKIVQERLGHADISMTLNTYSHVLPSMQEEAAEKLDELLTPIEVSKEIKQLREKEQIYSILSSEF